MELPVISFSMNLDAVRRMERNKSWARPRSLRAPKEHAKEYRLPGSQWEVTEGFLDKVINMNWLEIPFWLQYKEWIAFQTSLIKNCNKK